MKIDQLSHVSAASAGSISTVTTDSTRNTADLSGNGRLLTFTAQIAAGSLLKSATPSRTLPSLAMKTTHLRTSYIPCFHVSQSKHSHHTITLWHHHRYTSHLVSPFQLTRMEDLPCWRKLNHSCYLLQYRVMKFRLSNPYKCQ